MSVVSGLICGLCQSGGFWYCLISQTLTSCLGQWPWVTNTCWPVVTSIMMHHVP